MDDVYIPWHISKQDHEFVQTHKSENSIQVTNTIQELKKTKENSNIYERMKCGNCEITSVTCKLSFFEQTSRSLKQRC